MGQLRWNACVVCFDDKSLFYWLAICTIFDRTILPALPVMIDDFRNDFHYSSSKIVRPCVDCDLFHSSLLAVLLLLYWSLSLDLQSVITTGPFLCAANVLQR